MSNLPPPSQRRKELIDHQFKLVVIGDSGVGKSCLLLRFSDDSFSESHIATIGVDFRFKTIEIQGLKIKLQIWDTAGQDRFRNVNPAFYRGAEGIVLVYDVTQTETFNRIEGWYKDAIEYCKDDARALLIGNKADLPSRQVSEQMGRELASKLGRDVPFIETSAKNSTNVETAFLTIANDLLRLRQRSAPVVNNNTSAPLAIDKPANKTEDSCPCA